MDDYALHQELEALAGNAFNSDAVDTDTGPDPMGITIARWHKLFGLPQDEAVDRIMEHRHNLTRTRISEAHWDAIRAIKEAEGYNQEAYEYELELQKRKAMLPSLVPTSENASDSSITYLVELKGPLYNAEKVQRAAKLDKPPAVVNGKSVEDGRPVSLCCVDGVAKAEILQWVSIESGGFEPIILVDPRSLR